MGAMTEINKHQHPLDPLTAAEIVEVADICRKHAKQEGLGTFRFNTITLKEPAKADLLAFEETGKCPPHQASVILTAPPLSNPYEVEVDIDTAAVTSFRKVEGVLASIVFDDFFEVGETLLKANPEVQKLCKSFGINSMDEVAIDPWPIHPVDGSMGSTHKQIMGLMYWRSSPDDNIYAHPLPWVPILDVATKEVLRIECSWKGMPPFPKENCNYHHKLVGPPRQDIKPLDVVQPEGPSFTVAGNQIMWQKWQIRISFNWREGLVLHNVKYDDGGQLRPILHRASIAEMVVPYAEPQEPFHRRLAFDLGDVGIGQLTNSLELGCDCLGSIHYFDAVLNNSKGEPFEIKRAVCLHEEDAGMMWKHTELRTMHPEVRRGRRLVVSFVATIANYEYGYYWYFKQDGSIEHEVKLTGEVSTTLTSNKDGDNPRHGTLVLPHVVANYHQHLFCARLDLAVDDKAGGKDLVVSEVDVELLPAPENPWGNAFVKKETDLVDEQQAQRMIDASKARTWLVKNPAVRHSINGLPAAYKLVPGASQLLLATPGSTTEKRASFATKSLWVTPEAEDECYPGGKYPLQNVETGGLSEWTKQGRTLQGSDPVLWHVFGTTHIVRSEDFPVMPVESVGFYLKPVNFFKHNPAVDLPVSCNKASKLANGSCAPQANGACHANGVSDANGSTYTNGHPAVQHMH